MITSYRIYTEDSEGCSHLFSRDSEWEAAEAVDQLNKDYPLDYHWYEECDQ